MAGFPWYKAAYKEFHRRINEYDEFKLFQDHRDILDVKSCLSIGPGMGNVDVCIISDNMPNLQLYIAVEHNAVMLEETKLSISELALERPNLQTEYHLEDAEHWQGPGQSVDLIILSHVLYYLKDSRSFMKKCQSWLVPGGNVLVALSNTRDLFKHMLPYMPNYKGSKSMDPVEVSKQDLMEIGYEEVQEFSLKHSADFSDPNKELVSFCIYAEATAEEVETFAAMVKSELSSMNSIQKFDTTIYICRK